MDGGDRLNWWSATHSLNVNAFCSSDSTRPERWRIYIRSSSLFRRCSSNTENFASSALYYFPPHNGEAEISVLRALMQNLDAYAVVKNLLTKDAFFIPAHKDLYQAICELREQGDPADFLNLETYLSDRKKLEKVGGRQKLFEIITGVDPSPNLDNYAKLLIHKQVRRQLIEHFNEQLEHVHQSPLATDALLAFLEEETQKATNSRYRHKSDREYMIQKGRKVIEEVRDIELTVDRPDDRAFLLQELKWKYNRSVNELKDLYYKSLIADENEPIMTVEEAIQRFGDDVNEWMLHGFLPKGKVVLLHSHANVGKTLLGYNFIYHLATGTNWEGFPVTASSRRCLIVQADEPGSDMLKKLADRGIKKGMPIGIKTRWSVDHMQHLRREIIEGGYEFVLIDSLTAV